MNALGRVWAFFSRCAWLWRNRRVFAEPSSGHRPRLYVDVSTIIGHHAQTGIQRVVRAVWSELNQRSGSDFEAFPVYATRARGYCIAPKDFLETKWTGTSNQPLSLAAGDKFLGLDLAAHLLPRYRSQLQAWRRNGADVYLLVHDLLPIQRPDWFSRTAYRNFRRWFSILVKFADHAICTSNSVASDLGQLLAGTSAAARPRVILMQLGGDIQASVPSTGRTRACQVALESLNGRRFILMVGTIEPRKAYGVALDAFEYLWSSQNGDTLNLVIVGRSGWKTASLQRRIALHPQRNRLLYWLTDASDEVLSELYERCDGLFLASYAEGCGLPILEAAMNQRKALVRDLPVFREKQLPNVTYFDDDQPPALAAKLNELAIAPRCVVAAECLPTWSKCVEGLLRDLGLAQNQRCTPNPGYDQLPAEPPFHANRDENHARQFQKT